MQLQVDHTLEHKTLHIDRAITEQAMADLDGLRRAMSEIYIDLGTGRASAEKCTLELGPGHMFRAMLASDERNDLAGVKWLGVAPNTETQGTDIHSSILLNRRSTGRLLATIAADPITAARTAAMSAIAAHFLARPDAKTMAFIGCGTQARSHLAAFRRVLPGFSQIVAYSRRASTAAAFAQEATALGLTATVADSAEAAIKAADVVFTGLPLGQSTPFIDASWVREGAFVASADLARPWLANTLGEFDLVATDVLQQSEALARSGKIGHTGPYRYDLCSMANQLAAARPIRPSAKKSLFVFAGHPLADLAAARIVYEYVCRVK